MMSQNTESIIRKHIHDMRNHLNGLEMDAIFLSDIYPETDSQAYQISQRFKQELNRIESGLRFLSVCFADPEIEPISVSDLFHLWKSRSSKFLTESPVVWDCRAESEFIDVDGRIVADLLGALLVTAVAKSTQPVQASVIPVDGSVNFEVRTTDGVFFEDSPEFAETFGKNGGRVENETIDGEFVFRCTFKASE